MRRPPPRPAVAALLLGLLGASCGDGGPRVAVPEGDLVFQVAADVEEVRPGQSFPLTVVRAWSRDLVPAAWDDRALSPLVLRPRGVSVREDGRRTEETRRYDAYAFAREDVTVRPPPFAARRRDGGPDRKVAADGLRIRVRPEVDAAEPGAPELPGEPLREPIPWGLLGAAGAVLLLAVAVLARRALRRRPVPPPPAPPSSAPAPDVAARALARLRALREGASAASTAADVAAAAQVVRAYAGERFDVPTGERTTAEILADARVATGAGAAGRDLLARVLRAGDLVKFAQDRPTDAARAALLDAAEDLVRRTAPPAPPQGAAP